MTEGSPFHPATLAREFREARQALLETAERLPETRAYRATERAGWTLKHDLSLMVGMDAEILHLLERAQQRAAGAAVEAASAVDLRRIRGRAMHAAHEMRLAPLREHLAALGERAAAALEAAGDRLGEPVAVAGREAETLAALARAQVERAQASIEALRKHTS